MEYYTPLMKKEKLVFARFKSGWVVFIDYKRDVLVRKRAESV